MARANARTLLGRRIRQIRTTEELSQEALAERAGLHRTYVGAVERGERNVGLDNVVRLARALGTTPSKLLSEVR